MMGEGHVPGNEACRKCLPSGNSEHFHVVVPFQGSGKLEAIQIIKKLGGRLCDSYLEEGECHGGKFISCQVIVVFSSCCWLL